MLAALVEGLERAPRLLSAELPQQQGSRGSGAGGPTWTAAAATDACALLEDAGGLPLLRVLPLLLRSQHNAAVLTGLGLLPVLADAIALYKQKLKTLVGVLALRGYGDSGSGGGGSESSSTGSLEGADGGQDAGAPAPSSPRKQRGAALAQLQALAALAGLLGAALAAAEAYLHQSLTFAQQQASRAEALAGNKSGSQRHSHAAQAAAQRSADAAAAAEAASQAAEAALPLLKRGLLHHCIEAAHLMQRLRTHCAWCCHEGAEDSASGGSGNAIAAAVAAVGSLELQALQTAAALLHSCPEQAQAALEKEQQPTQQQHLFLLVGLIGWPLARRAASPLPPPAAAAGEEPPAPAPPARVQVGDGVRKAAAELAFQLAALDLLGLTVGGSRALLERAAGLRAFHHATQLLLWASLTFPPKPAASRSGEAAATAEQPVEESPELRRAFASLWALLPRNPGEQAPLAGPGMGASRSQAGARLLALLLGAVLDCFRPAIAIAAVPAASGGGAPREAAPSQLPPGSASDLQQLSFHAAASTALHRERCALQHLALEFAAALLRPGSAAAAGAGAGGGGGCGDGDGSGGGGGFEAGHGLPPLLCLQALRSAGLWELAFGPAFFWWSQPSLVEPATPESPGAGASSGSGGSGGPTTGSPARQAVAALELGAENRRPSRGRLLPSGHPPALARLRRRVLGVLELAASLPGSDDSSPEVACLLALLREWPGEHGVVAEVCALLRRLLERAPATTLAALLCEGALGVLPRLMARQLQLEDEAVEALDEAAAAAEAAAALPAAQSEALALLSALLRSRPDVARAAVTLWSPVVLLFALLWHGDRRPQALGLVLLLMQTPAASEDDRLAKAALYSKAR